MSHVDALIVDRDREEAGAHFGRDRCGLNLRRRAARAGSGEKQKQQRGSTRQQAHPSE